MNDPPAVPNPSRKDLTFGLFLAPYHAVGQHPGFLLQRDLELAQWCDRLALDEFWVGEHHSGGWEIIGDPALFLAAVGERTNRIRLGAGVVSLPYHNPFIVADRFVQLDHMTGGRAMLGVGPGALVSDAVMLGIDPTTQRSRMDEALGVILRLLAGEVVTQRSDWFDLREARLQLLPVSSRIPVAVASTTSPAGMAVAGKHGVGVLSLGAGFIGAKKDLQSQWQIGVDAAAAHGQILNRADWRLVMRVHIAATRQQAIDDVRAGRDYERLHYFQRVAGLKSDLTLEDEIEQDTALVGSPDDVIGAIERLWNATGGFGTFLVLAHDWANWPATTRSYELLAQYVVPHFRGFTKPLLDSYSSVVSKRKDYASPSLSAIAKAFADAGKEMPPDISNSNLR